MKSRQQKTTLNHEPNPLPPEILDTVPSLDAIADVLEDERFWPARIEHILAIAGFNVMRIEREEAHPVWIMKLTRTTFELSADRPAAAKQIRKLLVEGGIKIERGEFNIIDWRGDKLRCVFVLGETSSLN